MRVQFTLEGPGRMLCLPRQYNRLVQGFLYRHLDDWLASLLHQRGLPDPRSVGRGLRLFTFSRLTPEPSGGGRWRFQGEQIVFQGPVRLTVASPMEPFLTSLVEHLLEAKRLRLGDQEVRFAGAAVDLGPPYAPHVTVQALSPITVYRTVLAENGRRKTHYYSPYEEAFERLAIENLHRKWRTWKEWGKLLGASPVREAGGEKGQTLKIRPFRVSPRDEQVLRYKGTVVKAWTGLYHLELPPSLFQMAFDAGLGAKNSQGFGCLQIWERRKTDSSETTPTATDSSQGTERC